jgi:hypothetical protein
MSQSRVTYDNVTYDLWSDHQDDGFWGYYRCLRCGVDGTLRGRCDSAPEAIGRASARAFTEHHVPKHGMIPRAARVVAAAGE